MDQANSVWVRDAAGGEWRTTFARQNDRFGHAVHWRAAEGGLSEVVLQSTEGDATQVWPFSPVLQQLHFETRSPAAAGNADHSPIALLLGQAGRSHWSLSVAPTPSGDRLEFDVACRVPADSQPVLQSSYDGLLGVEAVGVRAARILVNPACCLLVEVEEVTTCLEVEGQRIVMRPLVTAGTTRRWKYWIGPCSGTR